jgi:hypothetical protein
VSGTQKQYTRQKHIGCSVQKIDKLRILSLIMIYKCVRYFVTLSRNFRRLFVRPSWVKNINICGVQNGLGAVDIGNLKLVIYTLPFASLYFVLR